MSAQSIFFNKVSDTIENILAFNPEWKNNTDYLDHAVEGEHAPELKPGELAKSVSDDDRPIILIGTPIGNVVIFKRYTDNDDVYVFNASRKFDSIIGPFLRNSLSEGNLISLFNIPDLAAGDNIGSRLDSLLKNTAKQ